MNDWLSWGLVAALFAGSFQVWMGWILHWRRGRPILHYRNLNRLPRPTAAVMAAIGWIGLNLALRLVADLNPQPVEADDSLIFGFALQVLFVLAVLITLLFSTPQFQWSDAGFDLGHWRESLSHGVDGFLASVIPTAIVLLATIQLRSAETQHPLLQVLDSAPPVSLILVLSITVVFLGPLCEELLFRVVLQDRLTRQFGSFAAIVMTSICFALAHGWLDGLALVPLSLILGYYYDRQQDALTVTAIHGLFNAANLLLQLMSLS